MILVAPTISSRVSTRCRIFEIPPNFSFPCRAIVEFFSRIVPFLRETTRHAELVVQFQVFSPFGWFNELQVRLLNPIDGIAVAAPDPARVE